MKVFKHNWQKLIITSFVILILILTTSCELLPVLIHNDDPFYFEAEEDGVTICIQSRYDNVPKFSLVYSYNLEDWTDYTMSSYAPDSKGEIINLDKGERVYFRAKTSNLAFSNTWEGYNRFVIEGKTGAYGNIMYLLDSTGEQDIATYFCFYGLFYDAKDLTHAPNLPATTLDAGCYMCMFQCCTSLTEAPHLPAETINWLSYNSMFDGCTNLKSVVVYFTDWNESYAYATDNWLSGVSETGVFYCPSILPIIREHGTIDTTNVWYIPEGWKVDNESFTYKLENFITTLLK